MEKKSKPTKRDYSRKKSKNKSRGRFWVIVSAILILVCLFSAVVFSSTLKYDKSSGEQEKQDIATPKTITIPAGQLSNFVNEYDDYEEVHIYKEDGTLDQRANDLEELCLDYNYYRRKIIEYENSGESEKATEARATFQQVNAWIDEYNRNDFETMYFEILNLDK
jgi:hypothetical protein